MKKMSSTGIALILFMLTVKAQAQETLQSVTGRGNTTTYGLKIMDQATVANGNGLELYKTPIQAVINSYDRGGSNAYQQLQIGSSVTNHLGRLLLNEATDDGSTAFQVNGGIKSNDKIEIVSSHNLTSQLKISNNNNGACGLISYAADNIQLSFDALWNSGWIAKDQSAAWISKVGGKLFFRGSAGNTIDANAIQNDYLAIDLANGKIGIGTPNPLQKFVVSHGGAEGFETYVEGNGIVGLQAYNRQTSQYSPMTIEASRFFFNHGYVGIGTTTPQSLLSVNGDITAKKVKVTATGWPDYVFHQSYPLPSLQELEKYVTANSHLPGIPSAKEIENNGLDLGEMNKQLLQKIEELTLYIIQQDKKITALSTRLQEVENR